MGNSKLLAIWGISILTLSCTVFFYFSPKGKSNLLIPSKSELQIFSSQKLVNNAPIFHESLRGSNLFFHEITSDTCESHYLDSITNNDLCTAAVSYHDFDGNHLQVKIDNECIVLQNRLTSAPLNAPDDNLKTSSMLLCTPQTPCFCTSSHYIQRNHTVSSHRKLSQQNGQFSVTWNLDLSGKDDLLENAFLRAAFEQSVKDYINNDILCSNDLTKKGAEFFGVEIAGFSKRSGQSKKLKAVSGNGKCKGAITKCKVPLKSKKKKGDDDDVFRKIATTATHAARNDFCDIFLQSTIFDAFRERLLMAASFNYNVDVDVINDLDGNLNLQYDVSFEPASSGGLDQVDEVDLVPDEPAPINPVCQDKTQCLSQRGILKRIFEYYEVPFDDSKHECLHQGINCNEVDLVTHIWMVNYGLDGKTIPEVFGLLLSLKGLFLGGNQLVGTIPSQLGSIQKLQMLWLEDNALTGTIPDQLGNLRPLLELNLHDNQLTGTIPTTFGKLSKLQMLNLGRNSLHGPIPDLLSERNETTISECNPFGKTIQKLGLKWFNQENDVDIIPLVELKTLTLYENHLSGTIPKTLKHLSNLADLSLAENKLVGEVPTEFGDLRNLIVLDLHGNTLTGSMPTEVGKLRQLKILNLYNNRFEKTIPATFGELIQMTELILDNNRFMGPIPTNFGFLRKLEYLTFSGNKMSGDIPTELGNLVSLKNLDIRGISVSGTPRTSKKTTAGTIPTELGNLENWKYVVFEGNGFIGPIPSELGKLLSSTALWLKGQQLSGTIPPELANLTSLTQLSFGGNALSGPIPSEFGKLSIVSTFDIGGNGLTGSIPNELGNLSSLEFFGLNDLQLTGGIPTSLGMLSSLTYLSLGGNSLSGGIPSEFGQLGALQAFKLGDNNITGTIPTELGNCTNLRRLGLGSNDLTGGIPTELGNMENLEQLGLNSNVFSGNIPTELSLVTLLETLDFSSNNLSGTMPAELSLIAGLKMLNFANNMMTGPIPFEFGSYEAIEVINLSNNQLAGTIPTELGMLQVVRLVDIDNNNFSGPIPSELGGMDSLECFHTAYNGITGTVPPGVQAIQSLEFLNISGNDISGDLFFTCSLKSLLLDDYTANNCSSYCGTPLEECNAESIGDAVCSDVGCSGSGVPSCTADCRLDYSSCSAGEDEMMFQLDLQTDHKGFDTQWKITDDEFGSIIAENDRKYSNYDAIVEFRCMKNSCYTFELFYSEVECANAINHDRMGGYTIFVNGNAILTNKRFQLWTTVKSVGSTCTEAPFPSLVSMKPSSSPTSHPTVRPSTFPSILPTYKPSSHPTIRPTTFPSILPTSKPSQSPSGSPSLIPSTVPSMVSSLSPSVAPSLFPPVRQSSTCFGGLATRAVDDNTSGEYWRESVTHTCLEANPWWLWDFRELRLITRIIIWNRTDCCRDRLSNSYVEILADDFTVVNSQFIASGLINSKTFSYGAGVTGSKVRVRVDATEGVLSLAEVRVESTAV